MNSIAILQKIQSVKEKACKKILEELNLVESEPGLDEKLYLYITKIFQQQLYFNSNVIDLCKLAIKSLKENVYVDVDNLVIRINEKEQNIQNYNTCMKKCIKEYIVVKLSINKEEKSMNRKYFQIALKNIIEKVSQNFTKNNTNTTISNSKVLWIACILHKEASFTQSDDLHSILINSVTLESSFEDKIDSFLLYQDSLIYSKQYMDTLNSLQFEKLSSIPALPKVPKVPKDFFSYDIVINEHCLKNTLCTLFQNLLEINKSTDFITIFLSTKSKRETAENFVFSYFVNKIINSVKIKQHVKSKDYNTIKISFPLFTWYICIIDHTNNDIMNNLFTLDKSILSDIIDIELTCQPFLSIIGLYNSSSDSLSTTESYELAKKIKLLQPEIDL